MSSTCQWEQSGRFCSDAHNEKRFDHVAVSCHCGRTVFGCLHISIGIKSEIDFKKFELLLMVLEHTFHHRLKKKKKMDVTNNGCEKIYLWPNN